MTKAEITKSLLRNKLCSYCAKLMLLTSDQAIHNMKYGYACWHKRDDYNPDLEPYCYLLDGLTRYYYQQHNLSDIHETWRVHYDQCRNNEITSE